jgi:hypothetical protein
MTYTILDNALPHLDQQEKQAISFQRIAKTAVLLRQELIGFLLSTSKNAINKLLKLITLFSNEIFDPNYKRRKTSRGTMCELLEVKL